MPFSLIEGADNLEGTDTIDPDLNDVDSSDNNSEPSDFNSIVSSIVSTLRTAALGSGSILLIIALIFAIIVANDAIFLPWFARLFLFFYVFTNMHVNPILLLGIPAYYTIRVASNAYSKYQLSPEQRKTDTKPYVGVFYGFLPLLTWKTNSNWTFESILAPFKIRSIRKLPGKSEPALVPPVKLEEIIYLNTMGDHVNYLKELVPGFSVIAKQEFGIALLEAYKTYMMNLNYSSIPPKPAAVQQSPAQQSESPKLPSPPA